MRNHISPSICFLSCLVALLFVGSSANAESWTDLNGTRTIEAEMLGLWNDTVVLQMLDGRRIAMPMSKLQAASRIQAQNLARTQKQSRDVMVKELLGQAKEASAPAPNPLPQPQIPDAYSPPTKGASCVAQVQWLNDQTYAGHVLLAHFDAMPPQMQAEAAGTIKSFLNSAGAPTISSIRNIGELIVTRQRWLFKHPRMKAIDPISLEKLEKIMLSVGGAIRDGLDPQVMDLNAIASMPNRAWIVKLNTAIAPYMAELNQLASKPTITIDEEKDGFATVTQAVDGETGSMNFELVDGFWMPQGKKDQIAMMKEQLGGPAAAMIPTLAQGVAAQINAQLQPLMDAKTERDFHASAESLFAQTAPMVEQQLASFSGFGGSSGRSGRNRLAQSGSDHGPPDADSYEMEMNMDMEEDMGDGPGSTGSMSEEEYNKAMEESMREEERRRGQQN